MVATGTTQSLAPSLLLEAAAVQLMRVVLTAALGAAAAAQTLVALEIRRPYLHLKVITVVLAFLLQETVAVAAALALLEQLQLQVLTKLVTVEMVQHPASPVPQ
jgi:hypothetical protein